MIWLTINRMFAIWTFILMHVLQNVLDVKNFLVVIARMTHDELNRRSRSRSRRSTAADPTSPPTGAFRLPQLREFNNATQTHYSTFPPIQKKNTYNTKINRKSQFKTTTTTTGQTIFENFRRKSNTLQYQAEIERTSWKLR